MPRAVEGNKKGDFDIRDYDVYCPKALANIQGIDDVLEDRCKVIILKRTLNKAIGDREPIPEDRCWQEIRDSLYLCTLQNYQQVSSVVSGLNEVYVDVLVKQLTKPEGITSRDWELWKPILVIAFLAGVADRLTEYAKRDCEERRITDATETNEAVLAETLLELVNTDGFEDRYIPVRDIKTNYAEKNDNPTWINEKVVGRMLKRMGFIDKKRWGGGVRVFMSKILVEDCAKRLGIQPEPSSPDSSSYTSQRTLTTLETVM